MRVLVDANVLADAVLEEQDRPQGDRASAILLLDAISQGAVQGVITPSIFLFICHLAKPRKRGHEHIATALGYLLQITEWAPVTPDHYHTALASSFKDVEDGIQFFAAGKLDAVISCNVKDFNEHVNDEVLTAKQFVRKHLKER